MRGFCSPGGQVTAQGTKATQIKSFSKKLFSIMAAKDYVFVTGMFTPYLAKKKKGKTMSQDRRPVGDNEILGLFEFYLRKWCEESKKNTVIISDAKGKKIFKAKLLDK